MPGSISSSSDKEGSRGAPRKFTSTNYTQRPPTIVPNYGRRRQTLLPKSNISRVLLYDNVMQQQMLDVKLNSLRIEKERTGRILDLHKKSFILRQSHKQYLLNSSTAPTHKHEHLPQISPRNSGNGGKNSTPNKQHNCDKRQNESVFLPNGTADSLDFKKSTSPQNDEIDTVGRANDIFLPEISKKGMALIEISKSNGLTTSLVITTETGGTGENTNSMVDTGVTESVTNHVTAVQTKPSRDEVMSQPVSPQNDLEKSPQSETAKYDQASPPNSSQKSPQLSPNPVVSDPRFQSLQRSLCRVEFPNEGFSELSQSFGHLHSTIPIHLSYQR